MRIGFSVFLMAVGAVLTFAVHATATGVNIHTVGVVLMIAGLIGLIATLTVFAPRRRVEVTTDRVVTGRTVTTTAGPAVAVPAGPTTQRVVEREVY